MVNLFVDEALRFRLFGLAHRAGMREVEGELVRLDLAAALLDVLAQDAVQRPVQQVRRGVVLARELPILADGELRRLANLDAARAFR